MAKYTDAEIIQILREADIPERDIPMMLAIAMAESRGDSDAVGDQKLANDKWDASIGLFQVRSLKNPEKYNKADKLRIKDKLFDPIYNAKVAYEISKKGQDWTDWSTYNDDTYKKFLPSRSSRSRIRIAGKGKGKPIDMAEDTQETTDVNQLDLSNFELGSEKLIRLKRATNDEKRKLKRLQTNQKSGIGNVTDAQIEDQKSKVQKAEKAVNDFLTEGKKASEKMEAITKSQKESAKIQKEVKKAEEQLAITKDRAAAGYTGYDVEAAQKRVVEARKKLIDIKSEVSTVVEDIVPKTSAFVNPNLTTNFDGSPKPIVPKGDGYTVYLGDVESFKQVPIPSLGAKTETATMGVSAGTNVPQDITDLENMWFNTSPKAQALVKKFKDIYAAKGKVATESDWKSALNATAGVNTDNPTQTLWETAEKMLEGGAGGTGTGPSAKELKNKRDAVKLLATELGVELTDGQINSLGYDYASGNIDATTVKSRIASTGNINFATGEAAKTIDSLKATAASYGVSYDPSWYNQSAKDILTGKVDNDTLTQQLKDMAKSRYPSLAKQIDSGYTVKQIASPYLQSMANILEINPNDITMEDPTIKQAFTSLNTDGQPSTKALWQFEQDLKQDPRWRFTKNAQTDLMGTARKVLQDFGLVY
jgi:hypothetical protein